MLGFSWFLVDLVQQFYEFKDLGFEIMNQVKFDFEVPIQLDIVKLIALCDMVPETKFAIFWIND